VKFHNYNFNNAAALRDCPHCTFHTETDSGARTARTKGLRFYNVDRRIRYNYPFRGIFWDLDGSLTGLGPNTYATRDYPHLMFPECTLNKEVYDGIICDHTTQLRRIAFYDHQPTKDFQDDYMKIMQWDSNILEQYESNMSGYLEDLSKYTIVAEKDLRDPNNGYTAVFATGHTYKYHYGTILNFDAMKVELSERWQPSDKDVFLYHNFTDKRVYINVTIDDVQKPNGTLLGTPSLYQTGYNLVFNETDPMEFRMVVNGKQGNERRRRTIQIDAARCWGTC
jgi:hypothetical protein